MPSLAALRPRSGRRLRARGRPGDRAGLWKVIGENSRLGIRVEFQGIFVVADAPSARAASGNRAAYDENAPRKILYEEYHPYGTSSYRSWASSAEVSAKRYRYTGKERDEETSLYYHGARYYAPWLGRWTAADPAGTVDGTNLFAYVRGSPVGLRDPNGMQTHDPRVKQAESGGLTRSLERIQHGLEVAEAQREFEKVREGGEIDLTTSREGDKHPIQSVKKLAQVAKGPQPAPVEPTEIVPFEQAALNALALALNPAVAIAAVLGAASPEGAAAEAEVREAFRPFPYSTPEAQEKGALLELGIELGVGLGFGVARAAAARAVVSSDPVLAARGANIIERSTQVPRGRLTIEAGEFSSSEVRAAEHLAGLGRNVRLRQPVGTRAGGGTSDLLVDGVRYDVFTPRSTNPNRIIGEIARKGSQVQGGGVVLDLSQTTVTAADLGDVLRRVQGITSQISEVIILPP